MENITMCTSQNCVYRSSCGRQMEEEPPNNHNEYFNFEYICNFESSWQEYIKVIRNK